MAENEQKRTNYDLYASVSKPFFSYKKPGEEKSYCMMYPQVHSHTITLKFSKVITSENRLDLTCYLSPSKLQDFVNILEGIMARRRDAFANHEYYSSDEAYKIPVTSFTGGKEEVIGALTIDTELIDGISRLRISYYQNDKNDSVEIVFNERLSTEETSGTPDFNKIDYSDIQAFSFVALMKDLITPHTSIMYGMINSAVSSLTRYISACFTNSRNGGNGGFKSSNNNFSRSNNSGNSNDNYSDYDIETF